MDKKGVSPGEFVYADVDIALGNDITAPIAIHEFRAAGFKKVFVGLATPSPEPLQDCHTVQNTGRDLVETVKTLQRAGLDVMASEPVPADSPLWDMPNVILTPHVSGLGPRYWERASDVFSANLARWLTGESLHGVVDKRAGY